MGQPHGLYQAKLFPTTSMSSTAAEVESEDAGFFDFHESSRRRV